MTSGPPAPDGRPRLGTVLTADDESFNRELMVDVLGPEGYEVFVATNGKDALDLVERVRPDVVLLDVQMPGLDGFEVCRRIKANPATRLVPVVMVTGLHEHEHRLTGINAGADDFLAKPFDPAELRARVRSLVRLKQYTDDLESAESVILSLAMTVDARDPYTQGHCERVAAYAAALGVEIQLPDHDINILCRGGYIHDIGKIGIPDVVLLKPGLLTRVERDVVQQHAAIGDRLCGNMRSLHELRSIVRHHHERLDGSGYPDGLRGQQLSLPVQIVGIVDVYDALTTPRPYRPAQSQAQALEILREDVRHGARDHDLVDAFIGLVTSGRLEELAKTAIPASLFSPLLLGRERLIDRAPKLE